MQRLKIVQPSVKVGQGHKWLMLVGRACHGGSVFEVTLA